MKRIITNLFTFALVVMFASACSSDDDFVSDNKGITTVDVNNSVNEIPHKYYLEFDIFNYWGEKYYTFIVTNTEGVELNDKDPFSVYTDKNGIEHMITDYSQYDLLQGNSKIGFDDFGLVSTIPYDYDDENGIGFFKIMKIGDEIAIWASKEKFTNDDLRLHEGDEEYYSMVSKTFELCYITTLKRYTCINYGMWDASWVG